MSVASFVQAGTGSVGTIEHTAGMPDNVNIVGLLYAAALVGVAVGLQAAVADTASVVESVVELDTVSAVGADTAFELAPAVVAGIASVLEPAAAVGTEADELGAVEAGIAAAALGLSGSDFPTVQRRMW